MCWRGFWRQLSSTGVMPNQGRPCHSPTRTHFFREASTGVSGFVLPRLPASVFARVYQPLGEDVDSRMLHSPMRGQSLLVWTRRVVIRETDEWTDRRPPPYGQGLSTARHGSGASAPACSRLGCWGSAAQTIFSLATLCKPAPLPQKAQCRSSQSLYHRVQPLLRTARKHVSPVPPEFADRDLVFGTRKVTAPNLARTHGLCVKRRRDH